MTIMRLAESAEVSLRIPVETDGKRNFFTGKNYFPAPNQQCRNTKSKYGNYNVDKIGASDSASSCTDSTCLIYGAL